MARSFGKIETGFWQNQKIRALSERSRFLLAYLFACPHGNSIGCFKLPLGYAQEDLAWPADVLRQHLGEVVRHRLADYDEATSIVRIVGWFGHNTIENENVAKAAIKAVNLLPSGRLRNDTIEALKALGNDFINKFANLIETRSERVTELVPTPEPEPEPSQAKPEKGEVADATLPAKAPVVAIVEPDITELPSNLQRGEVGEAIQAWNAMAERAGLATVRQVTEPRRRSLRARLAECGGMPGWHDAMAKVEASPFLRGERSGNGHDRWRASFDFVVTQANFTKLMEGNYDDRQAASTAASQREILEAVGLAGGMAHN